MQVRILLHKVGYSVNVELSKITSVFESPLNPTLSRLGEYHFYNTPRVLYTIASTAVLFSP